MRKSIAVIGEGITEKYYIESLKGLSPFSVVPRELGIKASNLKKMEQSIIQSITDGYDEVFCLIDMDSKKDGKNKTDYEKLKAKYHYKVHGNKKKGIQCTVIFIETEPCTELWFLFHFIKTVLTKEFTSYDEIEHELHKYRPKYEKTEKYFRAVGNLHNELTKKGTPIGSLQQAKQNAKKSNESKKETNRTYTYSEIYRLMDELEIPEN